MAKEFNITGTCYPESHYMVNLDSRLAQIKQLVDEESIFLSIRAGSTERQQHFLHWRNI